MKKLMVHLACFGGAERRRVEEECEELASGRSSGGTVEEVRVNSSSRTGGAGHLFQNKRVLTRDAAKLRLKKILNVKKDVAQSDKERARAEDPEFRILGKIYSELDVTVDLASIARNRATLSHLLPFVLNALLYGFRENDTSTPGSNRSGKKNSHLKVTRDPKDLTLNGTSHLVKAQFERQLESFLYQQAMHSVYFALECSWYFTGSLFLGPKDAYHRTMTLLLGMESVVTNSTPPGDLFKKADLTERAAILNGSTDAGVARRSSLPPGAVNGIVEDTGAASVPDDYRSSDSSPADTDMVYPAIANDVAGNSVEVALDAMGNGESVLRMQFNSLKDSDELKLQGWLDARRERASIFHAELDFIKCLTDISHGLFDIDREYRRDVLRRELEKLNAFIPKNVFIPTERRPHRILRIVPEDAHVFSTKERVPYLLVLEVEDLSPAPTEKDPAHQDDGSRHGLQALRKKASIGGLGHHHHHEPSSAFAAEYAEGGEDHAPNTRENKFEFLPDVTAEVSMMDPETNRESSFHVDTQFADDRRPPDEELIKSLGEPWAVKSERLRTSSPFGSNPNWRLVSCIVKARDQLRQEMFAQRLIQEFSRIFERAKLPLWLRAYQIISTSSDSGLIETLVDAKSIDSIKKDTPNVVTLQDYFVGRFGGRGSSGYKRAVKSFVQSMAGYSIVQYLLNIKDRHNGNLMVDAEGHIIHIDFGFLLSNSPGGNMEFEKAPFKLTNEMVQVMGGTTSGAWKMFRKLCVQGYVEACRSANKIMLMVDIAYPGNESMPCFLQGRDFVLENLRERFGVDLSRRERAHRMARLIDHAHGNWSTKAYDQFQRVSLGIRR